MSHQTNITRIRAVMPLDERILGSPNIWYADGYRMAVDRSIDEA